MDCCGVGPSGLSYPASCWAVLSEPETVCDAAGTWRLSLSEAIGTALAHCESVRVVSFCASTGHSMRRQEKSVQPDDRDRSARCQHVHLAVQCRDPGAGLFGQQKYWNLAERQKVLQAQQLAVHEASELFLREQALGQKQCPDKLAGMGDIQQNLDRLSLDLAQKATDVLTAERELRQAMRLPATDHHRIYPTTVPRKERVAFDWQSCLREMSKHQPDIIQQQLMIRLAELQLTVARNQLVPVLSLDIVNQWTNLGLGEKRDRLLDAETARMFRLVDPIFAVERVLLLHPCLPLLSNFPRWQIGVSIPIPMGTGRSLFINTRYAQYVLRQQRGCLAEIVHQTIPPHELPPWPHGVGGSSGGCSCRECWTQHVIPPRPRIVNRYRRLWLLSLCMPSGVSRDGDRLSRLTY